MDTATRAAFLPTELYGSASVAALEREHYASRFWHPVAAAADLPPGQMHVSTVWWLDMGALGAIPTPALESNVFTVAPGAALQSE
jgi:hypothetical protein